MQKDAKEACERALEAKVQFKIKKNRPYFIKKDSCIQVCTYLLSSLNITWQERMDPTKNNSGKQKKVRQTKFIVVFPTNLGFWSWARTFCFNIGIYHNS